MLQPFRLDRSKRLSVARHRRPNRSTKSPIKFPSSGKTKWTAKTANMKSSSAFSRRDSNRPFWPSSRLNSRHSEISKSSKDV